LQRAFRDALADLLPDQHGWTPTLRIGDFEVLAWLHADDSVQRMKELLSAKGVAVPGTATAGNEGRPSDTSIEPLENGFSELVSNKTVEDAAIAFVIDYERQHGRLARDTRHRGAPADVESDDRLIEVKATGRSARGVDLPMEVRQVDEARTNSAFHVYVVDNIRQGDPRQFGLIDLFGETLARLLNRAKEQRYYTVPFPVAVYDELLSKREATDTVSHPPASPVEARQVGLAGVVAMPRTAAIEWVLAQRGGVMRPVDIWAELQRLGRNDPKGDVRTTVYDLWRLGRVGKTSRGLYCSRTAEPGQVSQ
jgi:hypothetical protein